MDPLVQGLPGHHKNSFTADFAPPCTATSALSPAAIGASTRLSVHVYELDAIDMGLTGFTHLHAPAGYSCPQAKTQTAAPAPTSYFPSIEQLLRQSDELHRMHESIIRNTVGGGGGGSGGGSSGQTVKAEGGAAGGGGEFALKSIAPMSSQPPPQPLPMSLPVPYAPGPPPVPGLRYRSPSSGSSSSYPGSSSPTPVVIACQPCRRRKVRCDSARPICSNCLKRKIPNECQYDAVPRRRGPDKNPGTRHRPCKKRSGDAAPAETKD
ncbi:Zn(2)-C6 fungal-type domain-containing protein [Mycena kentingensis (nom. inval.)]|nr:Zn(2)-C6 fungal-type domain-containing protein [Mycena kentingensis (nom. inval.)]